MKVLLIGQLPKEAGGNFTTGIAKVVYELSKHQCEGIDYIVYGTNIKDCVAKKIEGTSTYYGYRFTIGRIILNILSHPLRTFKEWGVYKKKANPLRYEFYKANFQRVIKKEYPDVIHMNGVGLEPLFFANSKRIPIIKTCHGVFNRVKNPNSPEKLYADYITGLTLETKYEINEYLCVTDESKISIIPNGVDTSKFFFSDKERQIIRRNFGVGESIKILITVASVQERKGQLSFIKILEHLPCDSQYWIIGQGPDVPRIKEYITGHHLENKVRLIGYVNSDELYKYYSAADIYVHASTMEGQALCEIEAFSTGLSIFVNNKIQGTIAKEELESGDYYFCDFESPEYNKITEWIKTRPSNDRKTQDMLDWKNVANQYAELYKAIVR